MHYRNNPEGAGRSGGERTTRRCAVRRLTVELRAGRRIEWSGTDERNHPWQSARCAA
ncbi:hypothetical protein HMPREF0043_00355 [Actinobaculum sp. oral taxon 183 str. F0552]|nr:hypothetical protein HMPREF0043_00355 [Actinobaculum sp. oral taxon 183 str. F0552]